MAMKAYVTSIGEPTTDLCVWSLQRQGFLVYLINDPETSLWHKLIYIFNQADEDFLRVDADVVVNKNVVKMTKQKTRWWYQGLTYDWYKQDITHGGVQYIRKPVIEIVRKHINEAEQLDRPETYLYRLPEFHNPRKCVTYQSVCGLNGYHQNAYKRVKEVKESRGQFSNYDWELSERLDAFS